MNGSKWRYGLLVLLLLGLMLGLTFSGLAQETTPDEGTPTPQEPADVDPAVVTPTATVEITATVVASPALTLEDLAAREAEEPALITDTQALTETLEAPVPELVDSPVASTEPGLQLTVYNSNLGLVKEIRSLDLEQGQNMVRFANVAAQIQPTTVHIAALTDTQALTVLEQNYEYDIVNSYKLLSKYIDQQIVLMTQNGQVYTGTLLSGLDDIILATEQGVKVVKLSQVQEFSFPQLPEGLITKPTLVWLLEAAQTGPQQVRVTYLTGGITWNADYVAMLNPDDTQLSLNGWVSLDNQSGASYEEAKLKLVAGDINRVAEQPMYDMAPDKGVARVAAAPQVAERAFFEYHLYEVQRPVTVRDNQTKQIEFVTAPAVVAEKTYTFEASPRYYVGNAITDPGYGLGIDTKVQVRVVFTNAQEAGLGVPLPQGTVRVYKQDIDGGAELVGEDTIDHTPRDEQLSLYLGDAFDIVGERTQLDYTSLGDKSLEETYQIAIRNHKTEGVVVRAIEHLFRAPGAEITESSLKYEMMNATTARFDLAVGADSATTMTYTVRYRW